jgi:gamma-glutamylcyclotransferase (GGCT)/AIG2-like uncharacterized protein YtfP
MEYFAYGANMSAAVMDATGIAHRFISAACLPDHRFAFMRRSVRTGTGVADIISDPRAEVWGALYELTDEQIMPLDEKEGRGRWYEREDVLVRTPDGRSRQAMAYVVIRKEPVEISPSLAYLSGLLNGARERSLPSDYIIGLEAMIPRWGLDSERLTNRQAERGPL